MILSSDTGGACSVEPPAEWPPSRQLVCAATVVFVEQCILAFYTHAAETVATTLRSENPAAAVETLAQTLAMEERNAEETATDSAQSGLGLVERMSKANSIGVLRLALLLLKIRCGL